MPDDTDTEVPKTVEQRIGIKRRAASFTIGEDGPFIAAKLSRGQLDDWDRTFEKRIIAGQSLAVIQEVQSLMVHIENKTIDQNLISPRLSELEQRSDVLTSKMKELLPIPCADGELKKQRAIAASAVLLEMSIIDPKLTADEWLQVDMTLFDCLTREVENFLFNWPEQEKKTLDFLSDAIIDMDDKVTVSKDQMKLMLETAIKDAEEEESKKSSSGYGASVADV